MASRLGSWPRMLSVRALIFFFKQKTAYEIWGIVRELVRDGTTVLLTTQYLEEADQLADRIAVIDHGRVIAQGTGNGLKDRVGGQILAAALAPAAQPHQARSVPAGLAAGDPY